jgi:hypothetical protein
VEHLNGIAATYLGSNKSIVATMVSVDADGNGSGASSVVQLYVLENSGRQRFMTEMEMTAMKMEKGG